MGINTTEVDERALAKSITQKEGVVGKQEGNNKQDVRGSVEKAVMARDSSGLADQSKIGDAWVDDDGVKHYTVGGEAATEEEYLNRHK